MQHVQRAAAALLAAPEAQRSAHTQLPHRAAMPVRSVHTARSPGACVLPSAPAPRLTPAPRRAGRTSA